MLLFNIMLCIPLIAQSQKSWLYECRYMCSEQCRGKMFMEGVDIKCACDECEPMISIFENGRMTAIIAGQRAKEEVQKAGQYFYHYADELNSFVADHWQKNSYQISRVEYHMTMNARYVKYFLESLDGEKTAVAFFTDKRSDHYQIRCRNKCALGPYLEGIDNRPQEYCLNRDCRPLKKKIRPIQF